MGEIAGLPYWEVAFDGQGRPDAADADTLLSGVPGLGISDLMVFAHGWNNDRGQARGLYQRFFEQVPGLVGGGGGAAALAEAVGPPADRALVSDLQDVFTAPGQRAALEELARLLAERPDDPAELRRFQSLMAELATGDDARPAEEDQ